MFKGATLGIIKVIILKIRNNIKNGKQRI